MDTEPVLPTSKFISEFISDRTDEHLNWEMMWIFSDG